MAVGAGDGHNDDSNNNNNNKRVTRRSHTLSLQPEQQQSHPDDFALALALQEQENAFGMMIENDASRESQDAQSAAFLNDDDEEEDEDDDDDDDEEEYEEEDFEFFYSQEFDGVELEFLEGEESNGDEDMEEDDIDPDELSYELQELIALGEVVGEENRGLSMPEISSCLTKYTPPSADSKTIIDKCVICQVEYEKLDGQGGGEDEKLVALPCEHSYHLDCITTWLQLRKVCPICGAEVSLPKTSGS